jgi:hypothetical protein
MRRASRHKDTNHDALVALARALGAFVIETHTVGGGCPDLFVWRRDTQWFPVEVKYGRGTLRPAQIRLHACAPVTVWRTTGDVLASFGVSGYGRMAVPAIRS